MKYLSEVSQENSDGIQKLNSDTGLLKQSLQALVNITEIRDSEVTQVISNLLEETTILKSHILKIEHEQADRDSSISMFSSLMIIICILEFVVVLMLGLLLHSKRDEAVLPQEQKHYPKLARSASVSSIHKVTQFRKTKTTREKETK